MTTTDPNSVPSGLEPVDVYVALSRLADVRVNEHTRTAIAKVREAYQAIEPTIREANEVLVMHEAEAAWIVADLQTSTPAFDEVDGLFQLMEALSGHRELYNALRDLAELCDPDSTKTRQAVDQARTKIDAERMSPKMLAYMLERGAPWHRPAEEGDVCTCGQPATTVFVTTDHGEVPYCGVAHRVEED